VTDTVLSNDGLSSLGSVVVAALNIASVTALFERVQVLQAIGNGIRVDGGYSAGAMDVVLHDVRVDSAAGGSGIVAVSASPLRAAAQSSPMGTIASPAMPAATA
jgi:hypothetical protein